jgi:hypothetical protein
VGEIKRALETDPSQDQKRKLRKQNINLLGGPMSSDWQEWGGSDKGVS